jgi:inhibitor of the pro-sigma K processing machinery
MVIQYVMWALMMGSSLLLIYLWFRKGKAGKWLSILGMNLIFAVIVLFLINWLSVYTHFTLPFNYLTLAIATLLGIPGVLLLIALKLVLL